ncbi:unnamed protein product [Scytosiphon promiscuus]
MVRLLNSRSCRKQSKTQKWRSSVSPARHNRTARRRFEPSLHPSLRRNPFRFGAIRLVKGAFCVPASDRVASRRSAQQQRRLPNEHHRSPASPTGGRSEGGGRSHRDSHELYRRQQFCAMDGAAAAAAAAAPDGAGGAGGNTPLFVYGTLMNEKVLLALLDRVPITRKARLAGYHRYRIKGQVFPAIRPREGGSVEGLFMTGLDAREKLIFDLFEDEDYHKVDVDVKVEGLEDSGSRTATCYVWNASAEDQLYGTWEPSTHFAADGPVPAYVSMVERFAKEIQEEGLLDEAPTAL